MLRLAACFVEPKILSRVFAQCARIAIPFVYSDAARIALRRGLDVVDMYVDGRVDSRAVGNLTKRSLFGGAKDDVQALIYTVSYFALSPQGFEAANRGQNVAWLVLHIAGEVHAAETRAALASCVRASIPSFDLRVLIEAVHVRGWIP